MKTVVTGGTGFIGSHLVKKLVQNGRRVLATSNSPPDEADKLDEMGVQTERAQVDLRNYREVLALIEGADSVFHLAAHVGNLSYLHGNQAAESVTLQSNLLIDANVFRACLEAGVKKIVYASSCGIYPLDRQMVPGAVFTEMDVQIAQPGGPAINGNQIGPDGGYGWAKLLGEMQLNWTKDIEISIARLFNIYGEYECISEKAHAVGDLTRRIIESPAGDFTIYGDGKQTRDFLYISDCVDALINLEEKVSILPITVNIGSGKAVSIGSLAEKIVAISGKKIHLVFDATRPSGPLSRTADISRAKTALSWEPIFSLDAGLKRTYEWAQRKLTYRQG